MRFIVNFLLSVLCILAGMDFILGSYTKLFSDEFARWLLLITGLYFFFNFKQDSK